MCRVAPGIGDIDRQAAAVPLGLCGVVKRIDGAFDIAVGIIKEQGFIGKDTCGSFPCSLFR